MIERPDGVYEGLPASEYYASPRLNFSTLKLMSDCAAQCHLKLTGVLPDKDTDEMAFGRAYHSFVLTPKLFEQHYHVMPKVRRQGAEWEQVLQNTGLPPSSIFWDEELAQMKAMRSVLAKHSTFPGLLKDSLRELTIYFTAIHSNSDLKVPCKARIDIYNKSLGILGDIKTAKDVTLNYFPREIFRRQYNLQMAWYKLALESRGLPVHQVIIIAQRKDPGYGVQQYQLTDMNLNEAKVENDLLFSSFCACQNSGNWPSYPDFIWPVGPMDFKNKENVYGAEVDESDEG